MRIANNVEMLEIKREEGALYPVLTWDSNEIVLIDTGLPGQIELIREAALQAGVVLEKITKVIITHQDLDHIGCAKILSEYGAEILAHELETPYIQGDKTFAKITKMEERLSELDEGERAFYNNIKEHAPKFCVHVDKQLTDDEELDICGGIKVIHTPGHAPGHIALLLKDNNVLVTGDAANISDGTLTGANPIHTLNMAQAEVSFEKMMRHNPSYIVCYHGGFIKHTL